MSEPWMKFYPRDWRGDQALRAVSLAARGLWMECLCIMHEAKPYGHLVLNGNPVDGDTLARMTGVPVDEVSALMAELRQAGVLSVTGKGVVFSRRMTKDHARAQKGRKAANKRWSQASDDVEQSEAPNRSPNGLPTTQKPDTRSQIPEREKSLAQQSGTARADAAPPPSRYQELLERLLEANGVHGFRDERSPGLLVMAPIIGLIEAGFDLERDILPAIRSKPNAAARNWRYFEGQIRDYRSMRVGAATKPAPAAPEQTTGAWPIEKWRLMLEHWRATGSWNREALGPPPGDPGCRVPAELLERAAA